jgi:SAM-dependent methyltransferase
MEARWNHNIHHHPVVLAAVPAGARRALDVGCGDGYLTRQLRERVPEVVGLDLHEPSLEMAVEDSRGHDGLAYLLGDVLAAPFPPGSFDLVASVATLHHLDAREGLRAMADLVRPGGALAVVGLATGHLPRDIPREVAAAVATRAIRLRRGYDEVAAPTCWPPPESYDGLRAIASEVLPGSRFRRHLLWRCSITWTKPA